MKFTVQSGTITVLKNPAITDPSDKGFERVTLKVGAEIELTAAQVAEMDPTGHYLCPSAKYAKGEIYAPKAKAVDEPDEDALEELSKPPAKPSK